MKANDAATGSEDVESKKRPADDGDDDDEQVASTKHEKKLKTTDPPAGYLCNLCQNPGHWIQQCPDRRKHNKKQKKQQKKEHVPVPGVDPSPKDIQAAQTYQNWLAQNKAPTCFCGLPSRLKKVKNKKTRESSSRAAGKYFFFCSKKKEETPCRFARLAEQVMKEQKRKDAKNAAVSSTK